MDLLVGVLAQSSTGKVPVSQHCFYQNWGCVGVFVPLIVGVVTFLVFFIVNKRKGESEFET